MTAWADSWLSQKLGSPILASSSANFWVKAPKSKIPPERTETALQFIGIESEEIDGLRFCVCHGPKGQSEKGERGAK